MHPVPQGLTVHAAGFGRRFAVNAIEHQRKRKYPTRRRTIFLSARRLAKLRSRQIKSGDRYRRSHRCRSSQRTASSQSFTDLGIPNESQFRATGISSVGGTSTPSALAVLRFTTRSNLVGCSTGRSVGFAPLKILSTKTADRRNRSRKSTP